MQIEALEIRNYRLFRETKLTDLPRLAVVVGANGSGKSTLFDVFSFLKDALTQNVASAVARRGGFHELVSRGQPGPIGITVKFRESGGKLATYQLDIANDGGRPVVDREILKFRRGSHGQPWHFVDFSRGQGTAITNESAYGKEGVEEQRKDYALDDPSVLAIKGLGQFKEFRVVAEFRSLIESWHISDFHIADARPSAEAGYAEHLSSRGDNVAQVAQYLYEHHRDRFNRVLAVMRERVPGVISVEAKPTEDGRLVLRFQDGGFKDPFIARYVSDGTIKMFAYLVLLYDPKPHPMLAIEEPENQLYPELLRELVEEFRDYARRGGQVFVSTHSPDFLNGTRLEEIYWLVKRDGFTTARRASESELLRNLVAEGDLPGALWKQGLFEGSWGQMSRLVFLLEEYSMKVLLEGLLPRIFPDLAFLCVPHEGKRDLEKSIPNKLRAWNVPGDRFVVIRDNDGRECRATKANLVKLCRESGRTDVLVRLACEELEAWYLGEPDALAEAFDDDKLRRIGDLARFREPDSVQQPSAEVVKLVPEFQKVSGARRMAPRLSRERNISQSFHALLGGIDCMVASTKRVDPKRRE